MQVVLPVGEQNCNEGTEVVLVNGGKENLKIIDEIQHILKAAEQTDNKTKNLKESPQQQKQHQQQISPIPTSHCPSSFPGISQLLPNLFLCGAGAAMPHALDQLEIKFIINAAPELPDTPLSSETKPMYLRINVLDRPEVELSQHFDEVADLIEEVNQQGGKSLVHCVAGVSRSASLCLAYLMKYCDMSLREAFTHVKALRPQIRPNTGFFQQLRQYEEKLRGAPSSVNMVYFASLDKEIPDVYAPEYRAMEEFYQRQRKALKRH